MPVSVNEFDVEFHPGGRPRPEVFAEIRRTLRTIPGTFANVLLPLEVVNDALLVPTESLIPIQNGKKIFVSEGGLAKEIVVETGARTENSVIVLSGLKAGDTILTTGVMMLKNGSPVKVNVIQPASNTKS